LSLFLLGVAAIAASSHQPINLTLLPFSREKLLEGVFLLGIAGLISTVLAITRIFKYLFPIWAGYILYVAVRGYYFTGYRFGGEKAFESALWLTLALIGAFIGAVWTLKPRRGRLYR
jgi:hypothetical protein